MSSERPPQLQQCSCTEKEYMKSLNERFTSYVSRVRQLEKQESEWGTSSLTKVLEDEIAAVKTVYEQHLEEIRTKLGEMTRERTQLKLLVTKNSALVAELQSKLDKEASVRQKLEAALADAQRIIAEKDAALQGARNRAARHESTLNETKLDRDGLLDALTRTQQTLEVELAAKGNLQTLANELKEKLSFQQELHQEELSKMRCRMDEEKKRIVMAESGSEQYNPSEERISAMLAKIKNRSEGQLQTFKKESELAYEIGCSSLETQKAELFNSLKMERHQARSMIKNHEVKLQEADKTLMDKVRELGVAFNARHPLNLEVETFATLLEEEEKRLNLSAESKSNVGSICCGNCHSTSQTLKRSATTQSSTHLHHQQAVTNAVIKETVSELDTSTIIKVKPKFNRTTSTRPVIEKYSPSSSQKELVWSLEVDPDGNYVRVFNKSDVENKDIGRYIIRQSEAGRPVSLFRFPPRTLLKALTHTTVWSTASLSNHNPPTDFLWKYQYKWHTGPKCTTFLCKPDGQPVAWTRLFLPREREGKPLSYHPADRALQMQSLHQRVISPRISKGHAHLRRDA